MKGEIEADLDSPKTKAVDNFVKTLYPDHPYGNTYTRIFEALPSLTKEDVKDFHLITVITGKVGDSYKLGWFISGWNKNLIKL